MAKTPRKPPAKAKKAASGRSAAAAVPVRGGLLRARWVRYLVLVILCGLLIGAGWAFWKWRSLYFGMPDLPPIADLWDAKREAAIEFIDRDGNTLAVRGPRYGRATHVSQLPPHVPQAFIAAEDKRFYEHDGADDAAIARAAWSNMRAGETVSGASTITQQLIKNLVLDSRQTISRKAQEMKLARELETKLSKDEILSLYLNRVYFGAGLYGIDAASRYYFGKPPEELNIAEAAVLAALPKAPSKLNLRDNLDGAKARQLYVLEQMADLGFITADQVTDAIETDLTIIDAPEYDAQLGYVLDTVADRVELMLPRPPGDMVVTISIDVALQDKIRAKLNERMDADGKAAKASQASALVIDRDGRVVALVGGRDFTESEFNRVTQAKRQPGSSFKPFVYAAALESGFSSFDVFDDAPLSIGKWKPENYGGGFLGPMTLSEAMARSTNTIAAELTQEASEESVINIARRFGITTPLQPFPSIALGSQEVSLWEITRAFGTLQSGGLRMDPWLIEKIENSRGDVLYTRPDYNRDRVFDHELAKEMNAMMARVVNAKFGTGRRARFGNWMIAGKTGTSQDWRDAWFIGYTAAYVGGVWVGNDDDSPMEKVSGGGLPADLWSDIMEIAHAGMPPEPLLGAEPGLEMSEEAEERITFYRGMAQAFGAAAGSRSGSGSRVRVIRP
ncbi:transglycosylase domain-containing protein [Hyphomonas sp.]|uniref:transglycosylase domain-containing protein n=1 Tax=Hyphomonas sp. TaxID=87 RepID=UPI0025B94EE8|nr:PBP1A family penicillin-binding protein [Hyphomonas sp.]